MEPYQYLPLSLDHEEIRLIKLLPGSADNDIEVQIFHETLFPKPDYDALSYVWGAAERNQPIVVSDQDEAEKGAFAILHITRSLEIALRQLRDPNESKILWIDAICINQDDFVERGEQVVKMDKIYHSARQVVVWLGPSKENSVMAIQTLKLIGESVQYKDEGNFLSTVPGTWPHHIESKPENMKHFENRWIAIRDLLRREWFTRVWVFQEIGLATNAIVVVGKYKLDWEIFTTALRWLWRLVEPLNQMLPRLEMEDFSMNQIAGFLAIGRRSYGQYKTLLHLLDSTKGLSCSDPRDKLYGVRSLLPPAERQNVVPDYSKSVEIVYATTTYLVIQNTEMADILTLCLLDNPRSTINLPSWVPDFSVLNRPVEWPPFLRADGYSRVALTKTWTDPPRLGMHGVRIATIKSVELPIDQSHTDADIFDICQGWYQSISPTSSYIGGGSMSSAVLETFVSGRLREWMPAAQGHLLSLDEVKNVLENRQLQRNTRDGENPSYHKARFVELAQLATVGRRLFQTEEGYIGLCPSTTKVGDQIAVILGCSSPIALRPTTLGSESCFHVIGSCYVPGVMFAEALLGPLPKGWSMKFLELSGIESLVYVMEDGGKITQQDPRMKLPESWNYNYSLRVEPWVAEPTWAGAMVKQSFVNVKTMKMTYFDPRLTKELLTERGVNVREFVFI